MALSDYIPQLFGSAPQGYQGLLGDEQTQALQKQANLQGLLSSAAAIAQGMSAQGPRRSAAQNILGALGAGFGATGQAYQQGLQQFGQQQQLQSQLIRNKSIAKAKEAYPDIAPLADIDPAKFVEIVSQRETLKPITDAYTKSAQAEQPAAGAVAGVAANPLVAQKERLLRANSYLSGIPTKEANAELKSNIETIKSLDEQINRQAISGFDFSSLKKNVPDSLKANVDQLQQLASTGVISGDNLRAGIEKIQQSALEFQNANLFSNEAAKDYARSAFGTADITKLLPEQRNNVLAYVNAPSDKDKATIFNDAQRLKFETGVVGAVPKGRSEFLGRQAGIPAAPVRVGQPAGAPSVVPQQGVQPEQAAVQAEAPKELVPLVERPDSVVPLKRKQELIAAQPTVIQISNYGLQQVADQKKAAQELLNNPAYLKVLTQKGYLQGRLSAALADSPGTDTYEAANLLKNLQTRAFVTEINAMRQASKTGGAVGSVTEKEMEALSNIGAVLKMGMSEDQLRKQLQKYIARADNSVKNIKDDYSRTYRYQGEFDQYTNPAGLPSGVTVERAR